VRDEACAPPVEDNGWCAARQRTGGPRRWWRWLGGAQRVLEFRRGIRARRKCISPNVALSGGRRPSA